MEIRLFCYECGGELEASDPKSVKPCEQCLKDQYDNGYNDGYDAGIEEAEKEENE